MSSSLNESEPEWQVCCKKGGNERLQRSAIVNIQRLQNKDDSDQKKIFKQKSGVVPMV